MKYALAAAGTVLAITAANAETVWQGDIFVTSATSACASAGASVGDDRQAIFAPRTLPGNGSSDQIVIFRVRGALQPCLCRCPAHSIRQRHFNITLSTIRPPKLKGRTKTKARLRSRPPRFLPQHAFGRNRDVFVEK